MKINSVGKNFIINFCQNEKNNLSQEPLDKKVINENKDFTPTLKNFDINVPIKYSKIDEFLLPDSDIKVYRYKLANGQTIILAPRKGSTQINTYVRCGSMNEVDNQRGISHFIEHNLFNGSKNIPESNFFDSLNGFGAYVNAWTSQNMTSYMIISKLFDTDDLKKIIELHSNMIQYPKFSQTMLDKEKEIVNSEITMNDDDNYSVIASKAFNQLFQLNTKSNALVAGTVENINNLTRENVVDYYNKNYTPDKMITVLTGEFNVDETIDLISKNFTKPFPKNVPPQHHEKLTPITNTVRSDYFSDNIKSDEFVLSFAGPKNSELKEIFALKIATSILSGAPFSKLNEKLKPYNLKQIISVDTSSNKMDSLKFIELFGKCNSSDTEKVLKEVFTVIHNTKYENLKDEVEIFKKLILKGFYNNFETNDSINVVLGKVMHFYTPAQIQQIPEIIKSISEEDVKTAMSKYLDLNKVSVVVAHPKNNKIAFKANNIKNKQNDISDFKYAQLQNNAQLYLKDETSNMKKFILSANLAIPPDVSPLMINILTKILNKGISGVSESNFYKDLYKKGISLEFIVDKFSLIASGDALNEDIDYALNKAIDVINSPKFDEVTFLKIKKELKEDILKEDKNPLDMFNEIMFPHEKTESTKEQKLMALDKISLAEVKGLMKYFKQNSSLYFSWNKKEVPYQLNNLGYFKPNQKIELKTFQPLTKNVFKTQKENLGQAKIIKAYKFQFNNSIEEKAKCLVLNSILGNSTNSRLFTELREKQKLAYFVGSNLDFYGNTGLITLQIGTTTDNSQDNSANSQNVYKSLNGFDSNIDKLKNNFVSDEELVAAKASLNHNLLTENKTGMMLFMINDACYENDVNYTNNLIDAIHKVSKEDIKEIAQKMFAGNSFTSIVASEKTLNELNYLTPNSK